MIVERVPILNIPGYNVYSKYVVSVDPRLGVYSECNPSTCYCTAALFVTTHPLREGRTCAF